MLPDKPYRTCPTLEEILAAAEPGASEQIRASVKQRLQAYLPQDEALDGAIRFLQDHAFDFDALHDFLAVSFKHSAARPKQMKRKSNSSALLIAASTLLVVFSSWYYLVRFKPDQTMAGAAIYEPGLPVYAGVGDSKAFNEMMSAYRSGDAAVGLPLFRELLKTEANNDTLTYFGGWLYYLKGQTDSAAKLFGSVSASHSSTYADEAGYMQAISVYLNGQRSYARQLLQLIADDEKNKFAMQAKQALESVKHW